MAIREIVFYPDPALRETCEPVEEINEEIKTLIQDMVETMYDAPGIGLAAPQVGINKRIIVVDVGKNSEDDSEPTLHKIINPEIIESEGKASGDEGCLSIPDVQESVSRFETVTVRGLDQDGNKISIEADGMLSICLQHEIDHLNGVLFIDHLSMVKREFIRGKLKKLTKLYKKS